jgi:hypothetical protein
LQAPQEGHQQDPYKVASPKEGHQQDPYKVVSPKEGHQGVLTPKKRGKSSYFFFSRVQKKAQFPESQKSPLQKDSQNLGHKKESTSHFTAQNTPVSLSLVCTSVSARARFSARLFPCVVVIKQLLDSSNGALAAEFPLATSAVPHRSSSSIVVPDLPCGC